jgi:hypothetical protein
MQKKIKIIHQNEEHIRNKTDIFTAFLQTTTSDIVAIFEHGLKDGEITQCT